MLREFLMKIGCTVHELQDQIESMRDLQVTCSARTRGVISWLPILPGRWLSRGDQCGRDARAGRGRLEKVEDAEFVRLGIVDSDVGLFGQRRVIAWAQHSLP